MDLTPQVKDATDAIHSFPALADAVLDLLRTPAGWFASAAVLVWFLVNKKLYRVFDVAENRERRRLDHLDSYVTKPEAADAESMAVLRDLRDAHYFKIGTGIYAERRLRASLIWLHLKTSHLINWCQIRKALSFIEPNSDGTASIRDLRFTEKVGFYYNETVAYLSLLPAAGTFVLFLSSNLRTLSAFGWGFGVSLGAFIFAMFVFAQNIPERASRRIKKELAAVTASEKEAIKAQGLTGQAAAGSASTSAQPTVA